MKRTSPEFKPKVLIFKSSLLPLSETFIREQAFHLKKWKPVLIGYNKVKNGLDLSGLETIFLKRSDFLTAKVIRRIYLMFNRPLKKEFYRLKKERAQVLHVHFGNEAIDAWPLANALKIPMIVTLHGSDINIYKNWWKNKSKDFFMQSYPKKLLKIASKKNVSFIAVSNAIKKRAVEYGIPSEKIHVSYIGVDTQKFIPGQTSLSKRREILFVGRLVEKKGCLYLLNAFLRIQNNFPEYKLVIIGDGQLKKELNQYSIDKGIRVKFLGAQRNEQVKKKMGDARVLCMPSVTAENGDAEGFGIAILEAQACGVPVITSARGGSTEGIVHGITGFRHKEKDISGIIKALDKLLSDDEFAEKAGREARKHMLNKMSIQNCTKKLEAIYSLVYQASKGHRNINIYR